MPEQQPKKHLKWREKLFGHRSATPSPAPAPGDHGQLYLPSTSAVRPRAEDSQPSTESKEQQSPALSVSQRLWNAAYESLESDEDTTELVASYVKTLIKVLEPESPESSTDDLKDPIRRQSYMKELVENGRAKASSTSSVAKRVGDIAQFVLSAKGMIDLAVQNIQQAALPWAGVCIGLQILSNPGKATRSNLEGIAHVIARMDWYCALAEHLLDEDSIDVGNKSFGAVLQQLEERVISLYKTLLLYQMKSVRSYYRNSTLVFLRGLANLDDWDSDLKRITDAEDDVKADSDQFVRQHTRKALAALMKNSIEMKEQLGDICQTLQDLMTAQKEARRDDIEMACRRDLRVLDPQDDMDRIEKNKDKLFDDAYRWVFDTQEYAAFTNWDDGSPDFSSRRLLWIRGNAGTGKSMLMIGIIRELSRQPAFLAAKLSFFFCEGMDVALKTATAVLRSLMWLLLVQQPHLISHLLEEYKGSGADLFNDRNAFIALSKAFFSMIEDPQLSAVYFVVDALDECGEGQSDLIDLISKSLDHSEKVKWLVSSRPTVSLKNQHIAGTILGLDARNLARPVAAYIDYKLSFLGGRDGYDERTLIRIADAIRQGANNTFLWVALVFKELESVEGWYAEDIIAQIPSDLSELYSHIMRGIEKGRMRDPEYCKNALVAVSLAYRPLSLCELSVVAGLPSKIDPQNIVEKCGSFLIVNGKIVEPVHQSAKEYLIKHQKRGVAPGHVDISRRSIHAMSSMLVKNSYSLSFRRNTKGMQPPDLDLAPVLYSCVFWARHLCFDNDHGPSSECRQDLTDEGPVFKFLGEFFLRWVEILSLIELLSDGAESIRKLLRIAQSQPDVSCALVSFLQDAERFIRSHGSIIDRAPLQIYGSAILFTPTTSEVRKKLWHQRLQFIKNPQGIIDDSRVQVLEGHSGHVCCVAFSPVSEILASGGSYDCEIRLWNTGTGVQKQILKGHTDWVRAVVFSPDGNTLASASSDNTVRLWHVATGTQKRALEGYGAWAIAFSPDGKILALASNGVRLLDAETGTYVKTLGDAKAKVIAFSPNGKRLASASENVVELWDLTTGTHKKTLEVDTPWINDVAFSPNNNEILALGLYYCTIQLWNMQDDLPRHEVRIHDNEVNAIAFSPDGRIVATCSHDSTIQFLDADSGTHRQTLADGSVDSVEDISFSPDGTLLASAVGNTVRLWNTAYRHEQTLERHNSPVTTIAFSPDGQIVASASIDWTIRLWNAATGAHKRVLEGHESWIHAIVFSPDSKTIASASHDGTIRVWEIETGTWRHKLQSGGGSIHTVAFSPDGKKLAASAEDIFGVWTWDVETGIHDETFTYDGIVSTSTHPINAIAFSPDGKYLASATKYGSVWLWKVETKTHEHTLSGHQSDVYALAFSPNGHVLASASSDKTIRLWSTKTGQQQVALEFYLHLRGAIAFSEDGQHLKTDRGCLGVSPGSYRQDFSQAQKPLKYGLFVDEEWITRDESDLLWLPKDYRTDALAVNSDTIVLGHNSGELTFLHFGS